MANAAESHDNVEPLLGIAANNTEREQSQPALSASEARFRTLADMVPQLIWGNEAGGKANYFNQRWFDYSGLSLEESIGLGWQAIVHPDDAPASVERWQRALATGEVFDTEYRLRRADGVYRWHLGRNVPLRDGNGAVASWFGTATDIENLKQAQAAQRESEERFRLLVEGARDYAMFLLDGDNRISFWSMGAERVFGWSEAEALGQMSALIFTPEDRQRGEVEREIDTALSKGRAEDRRWHIRKDGTLLFVDGVLIRLDDTNGQPRGFVKIGRDATAQRQAEEAVQRARDELEIRVAERTLELATANRALQDEIAQRVQAEQSREELVHQLLSAQEEERRRVARELHDQLGQEITAILLRLRQLQQAMPADGPLAIQVQELADLTQRLATESHSLAMALRPTVLDDVGLLPALERLVEQWNTQFAMPVVLHSRGLEDQRLPPMIETVLYRIVQEALTNVWKHAQASTVSVIVEHQPGNVQVIIEDDGQGFDTAATTGEGARGRLGLLGMHERVAQVAGTLEIESSPRGGTTVFVRITLDRAGQST